MQCSFIATTNGAIMSTKDLWKRHMIFYSAIIVEFFVDNTIGMNSIISLVAR